MSAPPRPVFLERQSYRRQRLIDAARAIPVLGLVLFLLPLVWPASPQDGVPLAFRGLYLFVVWGALVLVTLLVSHRLQARMPRPDGRSEAEADGLGDGSDPDLASSSAVARPSHPADPGR